MDIVMGAVFGFLIGFLCADYFGRRKVEELQKVRDYYAREFREIRNAQKRSN
jgi:membrane protein DedA with SNARE-associated domain